MSDEQSTFNPVSQVYFRAGLLAARESLARFVESESPAIAASIRANWWPRLGDDPGQPRQLRWDEVAQENQDGSITHKQISPSVEAVSYAWAFLNGATDDNQTED